jgi:hypothetical protein
MAHDADDADDADLTDDEMFAHRERYSGGDRRRPRVVSEFVRRAIENTVGQVQSTGLLSRDALNYLLQQGDKGKKEVVRIVAHEVGEFLRGVDLSSEVIKVLTSIQVEVNASVRFKPTKDGSVKPEVTTDAHLSPSKEPPSMPSEPAVPPPPPPPPAPNGDEPPKTGGTSGGEPGPV